MYDACVTDVINAYIQCAKQHGYLSGRYLGIGLDIHTLLKRVFYSKPPSPAVVAHVVQGAIVARTPLQETPILFGDKETIQRKRARSTIGKTSHRPGFEMESRQRKERGRPRKISFQENFANEEAECADDEIGEDIAKDEKLTDAPLNECLPQEVEISNYRWAIRRMPTHCIRKCFGMVKGKRCTVIMQSKSPGLVAPCFWGERTFKGNTQQQWMWFCSHDVQHTKKVTKPRGSKIPIRV